MTPGDYDFEIMTAEWIESLPDRCQENWNNGEDFDWEDWRSNFDMEEDRWYEYYDMDVIFPYPWNHEGIEYVCDEDNECWYFDDESREACDFEGNCYTPEMALEVYFEGEKENWNDGADFNWDDWRSNFDMEEEKWYEYYEMSVIFPYESVEEGITWSCDEDNECWTFFDETEEACDRDFNCYTPEAALEVYFEGEEHQHIGISQGAMPAWCLSDLDEEPEQDAYNVEECWDACVDTYGFDVVAVDFAQDSDGSYCYCQNDCGCMTPSDYDLMVMTAEWMESLPDICKENWNEGADFDWEDWRSNFDMEEDRWYDYYDMDVIFPHPWDHEGLEWSCDEDDYCWYFNDETQEACNLDGECYTPEMALEIYFEGEDIEFNWEDWRSNFEMSDDYWFYEADMSGLFPYPMFEDNVDWMCDEEEVCFYFSESDYQVCIRGDECYSPEDALDLYFAHKNGEYDDHEDSEFNWDDWRSNFDLSDDYWFYDADLTAVFPHFEFADNVDWMCDDN
jgi:hypothetical protein